MAPPPVIAIDGPTASGKGTIAQQVAARLGYNYLDSGALYRLLALAALRTGTAAEDEGGLAALAAHLNLRFDHGQVSLNGNDVTAEIRAEAVGNMASRIAVLPGVRAALMALQRSFQRPPGLVADGRDMGTVVFPQAMLKVFLTASAESRADRRYKQLIEKGFSASITALLSDLRERDARDSNRAVAPLKPAEDSYVLDSTGLSIEETIDKVLERYELINST